MTTSRERLLATLAFRPADRAPFGVGIGWFPWWQTLLRWREESGMADLDPAMALGYDDGFAVAPLEYGPCPLFEPCEISRTDRYIVTRNRYGVHVRNLLDNSSMPEFIAHPLKTVDDWRHYKEERLFPAWEDRLRQVPAFAEDARAHGQAVQFGTYPFGVFGTVRELFGAEETLFLFYDEPDLVHDVMSTHVTLWIELARRVQAMIPIDHWHIWEDMSGKQGSLISMAMVEEFMMPQYDRIAAFCREHRIPVLSVDTDGRVDELVAVMTRHGVTMMFPFEQQCGNDIERFRDEYPTLAIMGGLDKNALADGPAAIRRELDTAERMLARGGYVPGCDHLIPPNVAWNTWKQFCRDLRTIVGA